MSKKFEKAKDEARKRGIGEYERHIFLCIGPDCCSSKEGDEAWQYLKKKVAQVNGSSDRGRVYRSKVGCLRICEAGPVAVVYPEGAWYAGLDREALDRVVEEHLVRGQIVEELLIGRNPLPRPPAQPSSPASDR